MSGPHGDGAAVLVFAKSPRPGQVKTRLMPALSAYQAARLHERMVDHALTEAVASHVGPVTLCCAPDTRCPHLRALARRHQVPLQAQVGSGLGRRMARAISMALETRPRVLLMGSDCPWVTVRVLRLADAALSSGTPVVLVPAVDGGYVLVGATSPCNAMFEGIPWGSGEVMTATRERLAAAGLRWSELPPLRDVDRPQDLDLLPPGFMDGVHAPIF